MRLDEIIYLFEFDTPNFSFMVVVNDIPTGYRVLRNAWEDHCKLYTSADPDYFDDNQDSITINETTPCKVICK